MRKATTLLVLGIALLGSPAAHATVGSRCRRICREAIDACVLNGARRHACRRSYVRACRQNGVSVCDLTPRTTTTVTTTTTSTTVPTVPSYAGTWSYYGTLANNECGLDTSYSISATLSVQQSGTSLIGRMGAYTLHGAVTEAGFYLDTGVFSDPDFPGCYGDVRIEADGIGTRLTAGLGIGVQCGGVTCVVVYGGSLSR